MSLASLRRVKQLRKVLETTTHAQRHVDTTQIQRMKGDSQREQREEVLDEETCHLTANEKLFTSQQTDGGLQ